ncbi:hypothetical protein LWI28_014739 [Acer negundo]|uniref:Reverse transcriptase Ty1/copia-type domain-containing protein n=1 Tax=Acer negundo TaxID=4023 RepID=A0AAD5P5T8_ACENE|nr:hypothetical protein LWI28_014739 [Acer negundo]
MYSPQISFRSISSSILKDTHRDHRGTPEYSRRIVTLEPNEGEVYHHRISSIASSSSQGSTSISPRELSRDFATADSSNSESMQSSIQAENDEQQVEPAIEAGATNTQQIGTDTQQIRHSMITRGKSGIFKPKLPYIGIVEIVESLNSTEPMTVSAALNNSNDNKLVQTFIHKLNKIFALKDIGSLHYFLGIEVCRDETGMYLTQSRYIQELLNKARMGHVKACLTPLAVGKTLSKQDGEIM